MRLPPKEKRPGHESYPMPDAQHKAAALGFAKMHHPNDHALMARLRAKAKRKGLRKGGHIEHHHDGHRSHHRADKKHRG